MEGHDRPTGNNHTVARMTHHRSLAAFLLLLLLSVLPGCHSPISRTIPLASQKKANPPTVDEVIGEWLGYTEDELQFYRLDLRPDFTGYCASVYLPDTSLRGDGVRLYRIERWELKERQLTFRLSAVDAWAEVITLKGTATGHLMNLEVGGAGWKRKLLLRPEANFTTPYRETKERVERVQKPRSSP